MIPVNGTYGYRPVIPATGTYVPFRPVAPGVPVARPIPPSISTGPVSVSSGPVASPLPIFATVTPASSPSTQQSAQEPAPIVTGSSDTISSTAGPNPTESPTVAQGGGLSPWLLVAGAALVLLLLVRR